LQTGIFFNFSNTVLKLPNTIIRASSVDNQGTDLITVTNPYLDLTGLEKHFYSRLYFYNRQYRYYVIVDGKADLLLPENNEPALSPGNSQQPPDKNISIRFRIEKAMYPADLGPRMWMGDLKKTVHQLARHFREIGSLPGKLHRLPHLISFLHPKQFFHLK
jgi:hypothetical protein